VDDFDTFPVLFEAPRVAMASVGQFMHFNTDIGANTPALWLGLDPISVGGAVGGRIATLNEAVWDGFFFSTLPGGLAAADLDTVKLPNSRYKISRVPGLTDAETLQYLNANGGRPTAAALRVQGMFNVNSVQSGAWAATLKAGGQSATTTVWDPATDQFFLLGETLGANVGRFVQAPGHSWSFRHRELGGPGGPNQIGEGSIFRNGHRELAPLDLYQRLVDDPMGLPRPGGQPPPAVAERLNKGTIPENFAEILSLANLVRVGRGGADAGPYFSLAEFVNSGVLETAIRNVPWDLNGDPATIERGLNWHRRTLAGGFVDFGHSVPTADQRLATPSALTQRELMQALAPVLSVRSDSFVIRAYGERVNPVTLETEGRAWCEAVVQREVDFVAPGAAPAGNEPEDGLAALNATNENFGRRFRIVSFRWLSPNDI
jgi:hypothetical protein